MLYLIGLGLYDERDITLRGLDAVRGCARVYLEAYTSILLCPKVSFVCGLCVMGFACVLQHHHSMPALSMPCAAPGGTTHFQYTHKCTQEKLEALYGKEVVVADREMVENDADLILEGELCV